MDYIEILIDDIKNGCSLEHVKNYVNSGKVTVHDCTDDDDNLLDYASALEDFKKSFEIVNFLIESDAEGKLDSDIIKMAVLSAIRSGNKDVVLYLFEKRYYDYILDVAVSKIIQYEKIDLLKKILEIYHENCMPKKDKYLELAIEKSTLDMVDLLRSSFDYDLHKFMPVVMSQYRGYKNLQRAYEIISYFINKTSKKYLDDALSAAMKRCISIKNDTRLMSETKYKVIERWITEGANVNVVDSEGYTPLLRLQHFDDTEEQVKIFNLLVSKGADVNFCTSVGTPLQEALSVNNKRMIDLLLSKGADLAFDADLIVRYGYVDLFKKLIDSGNHFQISTTLLKEIFYKPNENHISIFKMLMESKFKLSPETCNQILFESCVSNKFEIAKIVIDNGADVNYKAHGEAYSGFEMAVSLGNIDIVNYMLEKGANQKSHPKAIFEGLEYWRDDIVDKFITLNWDFLYTDENGYNALHYACIGRQYGMCGYGDDRGTGQNWVMIQKIVDLGVDPNATAENPYTAERYTPLDFLESSLKHAEECIGNGNDVDDLQDISSRKAAIDIIKKAMRQRGKTK